MREWKVEVVSRYLDRCLFDNAAVVVAAADSAICLLNIQQTNSPERSTRCDPIETFQLISVQFDLDH